MSRTRSLWLLGAVLLFLLLASGCGSSTSTSSSATTTSGGPSGNVLRVPADHPTIQSAVDAAGSGDLILVSPGVYHEAVDVTTDNLDIRGTDRNTVVLDGEF